MEFNKMLNVHVVHEDKPGCSLSIEGSKDSPVRLMINE